MQDKSESHIDSRKPQQADDEKLKPIIFVRAELDGDNLPEGYSDYIYQAQPENKLQNGPSILEEYNQDDNLGLKLPPQFAFSQALVLRNESISSAEKEKEVENTYIIQAKMVIPRNTLEVRQSHEFVFMLDISGSMGKAIDPVSTLSIAKNAMKNLIKNYVKVGDFITLYTFDTDAAVIFEHCPIEQFMQNNSQELNALDAIDTIGGATYIGSGFDQFISSSRLKAQDISNLINLVLLTDGKDEKSKKVTRVMDLVDRMNREYPQKKLAVYPITIGTDCDEKMVGEFIQATSSPLPANIHIDDNQDIDSKFEFLGQFLEPQDEFIPVKLTVLLDKKIIPLNIKKIRPGEEFNVVFEFESGSQAKQFPLSLTCEYMKYNDVEARFSYQVQTTVNHNQIPYPILNQYVAQMGEKIFVDANILKLTEYLQSSRFLFSFENYRQHFPTVEKIVAYLSEIVAINDILMQQPDNNYMTTLSAILDLQCYLSTIYCSFQGKPVELYGPSCWSGIDDAIKNDWLSLPGSKILQSKATDKSGLSQTSAKTHNTLTMGKSLSQKSSEKYNGSGRTLCQNQQLHRLAARGQNVKQSEDGFIVNLPYGSFLVLNSRYDFSHHCSSVQNLLSLDGGLENREGIKVHYHLESLNIWKHFDELKIDSTLPIVKKLTLMINTTQNSIRIPQTAEEELLVKINSYNSLDGNKLQLDSGYELPCVNFDNFINIGLGYCRHSAIYLALTLSTAAYKGVLEKGPINLFRYTAYNQQGHSWILYEPSADELYLLDATLRHGHNCFNLRNKDELIAAIEAYNAIDLNGILLDVLKQKNLYPVLGDENKHLLAIEAFNPAILEQFDTDEDFKRLQCLSGISSKLPCRPIRLLLKNMLTGEIVESTDIFDRDEIEAYESLQINDPFYPRKAALDPMGSMSEIIGRIEASDIKQTMLDLVVEKSIVAFPEKSAGPLLKEQSNQRKLQVAKKIAERAQQMAEKYINNKNDYSKKELDAIENGEAKTRDLPVKTSTIDGGVYSQCSHLMQFGAKKESEIINGVSPKPGYI